MDNENNGKQQNLNSSLSSNFASNNDHDIENDRINLNSIFNIVNRLEDMQNQRLARPWPPTPRSLNLRPLTSSNLRICQQPYIPRALQRQMERNSTCSCLANSAMLSPRTDLSNFYPISTITTSTNVNISMNRRNQDQGRYIMSRFCQDIIEFQVQPSPIILKVNWRNEVRMIPYGKNQEFSELIKRLANLESVDKSSIQLNLNDRIITENDTPNSIGYQLHMVIRCRKLVTVCEIVNNFTLIKIKIQFECERAPIFILLDKLDTFASAYEKCANEMREPISKITLKFDGKILQLNDKPIDFDIQGDDVIDCIIKP